MKYSPGKTASNTATGTYGARWVVGRGIASRGVRASHLKLMQDSVNRPPKWEDENVTTSVWRRRRPRAGLAAPAPRPAGRRVRPHGPCAPRVYRGRCLRPSLAHGSLSAGPGASDSPTPPPRAQRSRVLIKWMNTLSAIKKNIVTLKIGVAGKTRQETPRPHTRAVDAQTGTCTVHHSLAHGPPPGPANPACGARPSGSGKWKQASPGAVDVHTGPGRGGCGPGAPTADTLLRAACRAGRPGPGARPCLEEAKATATWSRTVPAPAGPPLMPLHCRTPRSSPKPPPAPGPRPSAGTTRD